MLSSAAQMAAVKARLLVVGGDGSVSVEQAGMSQSRRARNRRYYLKRKERLKASEKAGNKTDSDVHRGLKWQHMPGRGKGNKKLTFALFKRGEWPPKGWHVPAKLEGGDLMMLLHERACMNERRAKR